MTGVPGVAFAVLARLDNEYELTAVLVKHCFVMLLLCISLHVVDCIFGVNSRRCRNSE